VILKGGGIGRRNEAARSGAGSGQPLHPPHRAGPPPRPFQAI